MSYFNDKYKSIIKEPKDISHLLKDNMTLISGDFYGIQKFIFERLSTQKASKVLRAKSAFVQIFTEYMAKYICQKLSIVEECILSMNAGKFEILVPHQEIDIKTFQKSLDEYFIKNFYGLSGMSLSATFCQKEDFEHIDRYRRLREKIDEEIEESRFNKFDLKETRTVLEYDTNIDNTSLCRVCNIRKKEEEGNCSICNNFIELGRKLTKEASQHYNADFLDTKNPIKIILDKKIKSYIPKSDINEALDFGEIAQNTLGIEALGVLKADVDSMENFIKDEGIINRFESFDSFSRSLDAFFSLYIVDRLKSDYPNIYTVFTGGDDLFLIGAWSEIVAFARDIREEFVTYTNNKLTLSFGIAIAKPTTPISYLAEYSEKLLEESKDYKKEEEIKEKNAISLFGETVNWEEYREVFAKLDKLFQGFEVVNSAKTLYTLLELCEMAKNIKEDIRNTMWKSKLNYLFSRNIDVKYHYILEDLNNVIEKNPKETKMFLGTNKNKRICKGH